MVSFRGIRIRTDKKFLALAGVKWEEEGAMKVIALNDRQRKKIVKLVKPQRKDLYSYQNLNLLTAVYDDKNTVQDVIKKSRTHRRRALPNRYHSAFDFNYRRTFS